MPARLCQQTTSPSLHCLGSTVRIPRLPRHRNGTTPFHSSTFEVTPGLLLQFTPNSILTWLSLQTLSSCCYLTRHLSRVLRIIAGADFIRTSDFPPSFSPYDTFRLIASGRMCRCAPHPKRVKGVLLGFTTRLRNYLSQRFQRLTMYPHALTCCPERYEEGGTCPGSPTRHDMGATMGATAPPPSPNPERGPLTSLRVRTTTLPT